MKKIVFATNNAHKLREIRQITAGSIEVLSLSDIGANDEIEESGATLEENAMIKAQFIKNKYGYDCFADDTGLEVAAIDNAPGVHSARYAGEHCNSKDNIRKLLSALQGKTNRTARFRTAIALIYEGQQYFFNGEITGQIIEKEKGNAGFGYDPIFVPDGYNETFAELGDTLKNTISHRAMAMNQLIEFLKNKLTVH